MHPIEEIVGLQKQGTAAGIYSCCSANEMVLLAALSRGKEHNTSVLIEATANQVNQNGGYTGMLPADFRDYVIQLADELSFPKERLILGGDHLGPLTWCDRPEDEAMANARELVRQYAAAGFTKIHLDTSMRLADDDPAARLSDETIARRGAELCEMSERAYRELLRRDPSAQPPVYIIGSEVPIPGGAQAEENSLSVTSVSDCQHTLEVFREAFAGRGLDDAWTRVVGLVVQPGVEFTESKVFAYNHDAAAQLTSYFHKCPGMVLEGHSTDYQTKKALRDMVTDGIAILKVGPALTFSYREALVALEQIEKELLGGTGVWMSNFREVLEAEMLTAPQNWNRHYHGSWLEQKLSRTFSYSDRARYYLPQKRVGDAIDRLFKNLSDIDIPDPLVSQYMPNQYARIRENGLEKTPRALVIDHIGDCIDTYLYATGIIAY